MPPAAAKGRKAAQKKKEVGVLVHSPTNSQENGERNEEHELISQEEKDFGAGGQESDHPISSDTQRATMEDGSENSNVAGEIDQKKEDEAVPVTVPVIEETSLPNPDSEIKASVTVEHVESSANGESKPVENLPESEAAESVGSVSVTDPADNTIEQVVLVEEVVIPEATTEKEVVPLEHLEVAQVAEIDSTENSVVTQIAEGTVVENDGAVGESDTSSVETRETTTQLLSETVSGENPTVTVQSHNGGQDPGSISNEDNPVISVISPVRRTSWSGCCGLFELMRPSRR